MGYDSVSYFLDSECAATENAIGPSILPVEWLIDESEDVILVLICLRMRRIRCVADLPEFMRRLHPCLLDSRLLVLCKASFFDKHLTRQFGTASVRNGRDILHFEIVLKVTLGHMKWGYGSIAIIFTTRRYVSAVYAVVMCLFDCPSVCPSVTRRYCTKTAKRIQGGQKSDTSRTM